MFAVRLGVAAALVEGAIVPGDMSVEGERVEAVGLAPAGRSGLAAPGFIDLQVNGFAGHNLFGVDARPFASVAEPLAASGVTGYLPAFVTAPIERYRTALGVVAALGERPGGGPRVLGVHLEGPFLAPTRVGAHDAAALMAPDVAVATELCDAGSVKVMTLAPELPGASDLIELLAARGVVVSYGHSEADSVAGAGTVTHLFNAMSRDLAAAAMADSSVTVQVIADGVHVPSERVVAAWQSCGGRVALVTDSVAAGGLGDREVVVSDDAVRLPNGRLAGSVLTMDRAVRNVVAWGVPLVDALRAASAVPARLLGRTELGSLAPGAVADLVVLNDRLDIVRTLIEGREVWAA